MKAHSLHQKSSMNLLYSFTHITSTPRYPQNNGKIEATVKSMNKIIRSSWNGRHLDEDKLCCALLQYRNTPSCKDGLFLAQKLYSQPVQDVLLVTTNHSQTSGSKVVRRLKRQPHTAERKQKPSTTPMHVASIPEIQIRFNISVQDSETKLWDIIIIWYSTVTDIGPHCRYYIKTQNGHILVRNCTVVSQHQLPTHRTNNLPKANQPLYRDGPVTNVTQRERSLRTPLGFTKDLQHLCQYHPQKLGGEV